MGFMSKDSGGGSNFEPLPMGTHLARCVSCIDLGVQETRNGGKEKVYLGFEVAAVRVEWEKDGVKHSGPAFIGSTYNNSINERAILGQHLTSWRGVAFTEAERQGFDLFTVVGAPCLISVIHNESGGNIYANINGIMRVPKGMTVPPAETDLLAYSPMDQATAGNLVNLPEWLQKKVRVGWKMAEGSNVIGSAAAAQQQVGAAVAPGQPAPQYVPPPAAPMAPTAPPTVEQQLQPPPAASYQAPKTAAQVMEDAMGDNPPPDDFDDDIPF